MNELYKPYLNSLGCPARARMLDVRRHRVLALLALGQVDAAQRAWVLLSRSNDPRHSIEQKMVGGRLGRARGDLQAAQDCLGRARERMKVSGYALYPKGVKRLEDALRDPSLPADLRF